MKKFNLFLVTLVSLTVLATSCNKPVPPVPPVVPTDITLAVSGGSEVVLMDANITKDILITASAVSTVGDITVSLTSNAAADEATLSAASVVIKKGEKTATAKITFLAAKFPKGTDAKKIVVTIDTKTENVKAEVATTEFSVKGDGGVDLSKLTIKGSGDANTTAADAVYKLTFTLDKAVKEELPVVLTLGAETSDEIKALLATMPAPKIAADATTLSLDLVTIPKGVAGKLVVNFAISSEGTTLETSTLSATFTVDEPVVPSLCEPNLAKHNNTWATLSGFMIGDKIVDITFSGVPYLNMTEKTIATVKGGDVIKIGAKSNKGDNEGVYAHVWVDWNKDNQVTADEMVGTTTTKATAKETNNPDFLIFELPSPAGVEAGVYRMRIGTNYKDGKSGCANEGADESRTTYDLTINFTPGTTEEPDPEPGVDPTYSIVRKSTGDIVVPATGDKTETFTVKLSGASEEAVTINLAATSSTAANGALSATTVEFAIGEKEKDVTITFASATFTSDAVTASVTVTASNADLTATAASIVYSVKGTATTTPVEKQDLKYAVYSESGNKVVFAAADVSKIVKLYVQKSSGTQVGDVTITATITGLDAADYTIKNEGAVVSTAASGFERFQVTLNKSAIGKTCIITIASDDTTISDTRNSLSFPVSLTQAPASPYDYKVNYTALAENNVTEISDGGKTVIVKSGSYFKLAISTTGDVVPEQGLFLKSAFTGGLKIYGLEAGIYELTSKSTTVWVSIDNFSSLKDGDTGVFTFTSDYTTFADGAGITFTIKK